MPYYPNNITDIDGKCAGLLPNRLIYQDDLVANVKEAEVKIIQELYDTVKETYALSEDYLKNYLRITALKFTLPDNENIVFTANKLLDTAELQEKYYPDITTINWRDAIDKLNGDKFYCKAFKGIPVRNKYNFPSLIEIATSDYEKKNQGKYYSIVYEIFNTESDDKNTENEFINELKEETSFSPLKFRPYHKYVAVVESDGDNMGKTIEAIGKDPEAVKQFSEALYHFITVATEKIQAYGGKPVYSGGDDLVFFAPVATIKENSLISIFGLINDIDTVFTEKILENEYLKPLYEGGLQKPTMSYGVNVSYYKFPLNEARDTAHSLLFYKAKKTEDKNKICFRFRKHSGQTLNVMVDKYKERSYENFQNLLLQISLDDELISSVIYKLKTMSPILKQIATNEERLYTFFNQEFEVDASKTDGLTDKEEFIQKIVKYYFQLSIDFPKDNVDLPDRETVEDHSNIGKLYSVLRFMKHLISDNNE
jgi:CRISPR-associated protein Cmr2